MKTKNVLILGLNGQDGYYLNRILSAEKNLVVYGMIRSETKQKHDFGSAVVLEGDLCDYSSLRRVIDISQPDYIFNMAGFSHIGKSYLQPDLVFNTNTISVVHLLELIKNTKAKMLQASSYEVFAGSMRYLKHVNEDSTVAPVSPYSISKASADMYIKLYRDKFNTKCYSIYYGNHESPLRPTTFVTQKIIQFIKDFKNNKVKTPLLLGNIHAERNFAHAYDLMNQTHYVMNNIDSDILLAGKHVFSIQEFLETSLEVAEIDFNSHGHGDNYVVLHKNEPIVCIDPGLYRPNDTPRLCGKSKFVEQLPEEIYDLRGLIKDMLYDNNSSISYK